jgi:thioredoxin 1
MQSLTKIILLLALAGGLGAAIWAREARRESRGVVAGRPVPVLAAEEPIPPTYGPSAPGLPRLVAIGAGECIPCKAMAPIRAELRREYAGVVAVDFYDVWKDPHAGRHFRAHAIPTLIYFDRNDRELGRRIGYVPKVDIVAALARYGMAGPAGSR